MKEKRGDLTPPYFQYTARFLRPFPNFDFYFIKPLRQKAVNRLNLKEGDRVLDLGCGPGGLFPYLVRVVGPSGRVVGVEISPEVLINARKRIATNGWKNVDVIEADARTVHLTGSFDGAAMFAAADVYGSEEALENILPHLRENARVVAFGYKIPTNRLGKLLVPLLRALVSKLSFPTTPKPEYEPWRILAKRVDRLDIEEYFSGLMFLASGSVVSKAA